VVDKPFENVDEPSHDAAPEEPPPFLAWRHWWEKQLGVKLPRDLYTEVFPGR